MSKTSIEWTEHNWNPFLGCRRKSDGCLNCYAEKIAARFSGLDKSGNPLPFHGIAKRVGGEARWTGNVAINETTLLSPINRRKPTTFFVNSMSDTFYSEFPDEWLFKLFAVTTIAHQHTFQILTKRALRMRDFFSNPETRFRIADEICQIHNELENDDYGRAAMRTHKLLADGALGKSDDGNFYLKKFPQSNLWLGVSVENRAQTYRIDWLRKTPAQIRWISFEPLLENLWELDLTGVDWVVIGGESGIGARPCEIRWIRRIAEQCQNAGIPYFVKQLGRNPKLEGKEFIQTKRSKGNQMEDFPVDLRVRQFPQIAEGEKFLWQENQKQQK